MVSQRRIYLDHAATTPLDPRVLEGMLPYLTERFGNPSSIYYEAREARKGLDGARRAVAEVLGCRPPEVICTSGGSESDVLALRGVAYASRGMLGPDRRPHLVTTATEHHAVLHTAEALEREGFDVTVLKVDRQGFVDAAQVAEAVTERTVLVSVMYANNEVGTVEPIAEVARAVKQKNPRCAVHTDGVQAAGVLDLEVDRLGVDLLSLSAHKFYGPKGVGVLYVRQRTPLQSLILGGSQEKNRRAGTENVAGAVGLATALRLAQEERPACIPRLRALRDRLLREVPARVPGTRITGPLDPERRLPGSFSCCFEGIEGEPVLMQLDLQGISCSSGSACTTGSLDPSHVLLALGVPRDLARGSIRITLGKENTDEDIDRLLEVLPEAVERIRSLSPLARRAAAPAGGLRRENS